MCCLERVIVILCMMSCWTLSSLACTLLYLVAKVGSRARKTSFRAVMLSGVRSCVVWKDLLWFCVWCLAEHCHPLPAQCYISVASQEFPERGVTRGGRDPAVSNSAWESIFQMNVNLHFYLKIGFLEYLRSSSEIRYPNEPIGYWKRVTIWKEACIVHVEAIHDY